LGGLIIFRGTWRVGWGMVQQFQQTLLARKSMLHPAGDVAKNTVQALRLRLINQQA